MNYQRYRRGELAAICTREGVWNILHIIRFTVHAGMYEYNRQYSGLIVVYGYEVFNLELDRSRGVLPHRLLRD